MNVKTNRTAVLIDWGNCLCIYCGLKRTRFSKEPSLASVLMILAGISNLSKEIIFPKTIAVILAKMNKFQLKSILEIRVCF